MLAFCCPSSSCPSLRKKIELKMSFDTFEFSCIDHVVCDFRACADKLRLGFGLTSVRRYRRHRLLTYT